MSSEANTSLPLDAQRVVSVKLKGHRYTLTFDRITKADWERFFSGLQVMERNVDSGRLVSNNREFQLLLLASSKLVRVDGYSGDLMARENWKDSVHPALIRAAAATLVSVGYSSVSFDKPLDGECIESVLDAAWGQSTYKGLVHRFSPPTVDHKRSYLMAGSKSTIIGGSRDGATLHASRWGATLKIYDELIQSVEGYSWEERPLSSSAEIRERMDCYHKVEAVAQLFEGGSPMEEAQAELAEAA